MRIAIIGYGRMGKKIEQLAKAQGIEISHIIDSKKVLEKTKFEPDEVAIEFTGPDTCTANLQILANKMVPTVCGTTGWYDNLETIRLLFKNKAAFLYASNFSLGVNIFWEITSSVSKIINRFSNYDIAVHETHHNKKKDSPSGTAITTANILLNNIKRKHNIITEISAQQTKSTDIQVSYTRCGNIIGDHEVIFSGLNDCIKISHQSYSRTSYANGSIECAKWIFNKKGFYNINDYIKEVINA